MKRNVALEIGFMMSLLSEWTMTSYTLLRNSTTTLKIYTSNLQQYQLTGLTNGGVRVLIVKGQDEKIQGSSDHQYDAVAVGTGRRIIGQLAGHEIHLEIEDVLDRIIINSLQEISL